MAKKNRSNGNSARTAEEVSAPEGFTINVGRERGEGWVKKEEGNEVMARIVGRYTYENRGKKRAYYQLKLLKACKIEIEDPNAPEMDEDSEEETPRITIEADAGALVNCDETAKLADLEPFTRNGGIYDVWFVWKGKKDIGGGQKMWEMLGPKVKVVSRPSEVPTEDSPF